MRLRIHYSCEYERWSCYLDWSNFGDAVNARDGHELARALRRLVWREDPSWAERLLFDPEGSGTSCDARDPRDLARLSTRLQRFAEVDIDWEGPPQLIDDGVVLLPIPGHVTIWFQMIQHQSGGCEYNFWAPSLISHLGCHTGDEAAQLLTAQAAELGLELQLQANTNGLGMRVPKLSAIQAAIASWNKRWPTIELAEYLPG
jgi:hypothetical protein